MHDDRHVARCPEEAAIELGPEQLHPVEQCHGIVRVTRVVAGCEGGGRGLDPRHSPSFGQRRPCPFPSYTSRGTASVAIASISAAARSNSSSERTGVPSKGNWRWSSTHDLHPPYSSRTLTVTGRGIRYVRSRIT